MTTTLKQPRQTLPGVITKSAWHPPMICLYGDAGIGKSTFGASAPNPIFVTTEAGVENLDVARFPVAETLDAFLANLALVANEEHEHGAVVIDTLNGLMQLYYQAKKIIIGEKNKPLYDFVGFGGHSGWAAVANDVKIDVFPLLAKCQRRGLYVILLAHAGTYTDKTSIEDVVKTGASINKTVWKAILGEMDVVGKAEYMYSTKSAGGKESTKVRASTDVEVIDGVKVKQRRVIFEGGMEVDAKTRVGYELPPEMPLSWEAFESSLGNIQLLASQVRELWKYQPADKQEATLAWLGVKGLDDLVKANRSRLSQLRNRLLDAKTAADAAGQEQEKALEQSTESAGDAAQ